MTNEGLGVRVGHDPRLQLVVDGAAAAPTPEGLSVAELRARGNAGIELMYELPADKTPPIASTVDYEVPVTGDTITLRVHTPDRSPPFPAHVYLHGGAFWLGELEPFDNACRWLAHHAGCVVASVDYRLAPEHPFPTPPEDCFAALCWLAAHADELQIDEHRISIGGASAGGNLAAVVSLMTRDRGGPPVVFQVLEIPVTDLTASFPSVAENDGYLLTRAGMEQTRDYYLADPADAKHPYASPILASELTGLPPALVLIAEYDPLRDEGRAYGERLQEAGVPTTIKQFDGQIHGSQLMDAFVPDVAEECRNLIAAALRAAYQ